MPHCRRDKRDSGKRDEACNPWTDRMLFLNGHTHTGKVHHVTVRCEASATKKHKDTGDEQRNACNDAYAHWRLREA